MNEISLFVNVIQEVVMEYYCLADKIVFVVNATCQNVQDEFVKHPILNKGFNVHCSFEVPDCPDNKKLYQMH